MTLSRAARPAFSQAWMTEVGRAGKGADRAGPNAASLPIATPVATTAPVHSRLAYALDAGGGFGIIVMREPGERAQKGAARFATTHWSVVVAAGESPSERSRMALAELCEAYWRPLYAFLRRRGIEPHEAEDLTQAFLADFLARNQVSRADRNLGRFRSFLAASLENYLHNEWRRRSARKRGDGRPPLSLDVASAEESLALDPAGPETPAAAYDRQWARSLLSGVVTELRRQWEAENRGELFREFEAHLWQDASAVPYAELSTRFNLTPVNLRVTFHRLRQQYRQELRRAVARTVAHESDVEHELRFLMQVVSQ